MSWQMRCGQAEWKLLSINMKFIGRFCYKKA